MAAYESPSKPIIRKVAANIKHRLMTPGFLQLRYREGPPKKSRLEKKKLSLNVQTNKAAITGRTDKTIKSVIHTFALVFLFFIFFFKDTINSLKISGEQQIMIDIKDPFTKPVGQISAIFQK
ncbi:MAG TPA: hypothetical protein VG964_01215 [Candidatus Saccharimonadales bacterium]|nr:hypothetical protein [Candidatus Saccharimonadales bacterium]